MYSYMLLRSFNLLPINIRKRVSRKNCSSLGDYKKDVDDGILEEVRILNEEYQIYTVASCEGHLPYSSAYILGHITDLRQSIFKEYMKENHINPINKGKDKIEFLFEEIDYMLNISIVEYYIRGSKDGFLLDVKSNIEEISQNEWDKMRKTGFQKAIKLIKKAFS